MVLRDFNLLITTSRGNEDDVCSEIWYLLRDIGDEAATVEKTGVSGLIAVKTSFNPFEVVGKLREILKERPYEFRYSLRIIPIEKTIRTDLKEIRRVATEMGSRIGENESFRVTVEKRFTEISKRDIIEAATERCQGENSHLALSREQGDVLNYQILQRLLLKSFLSQFRLQL